MREGNYESSEGVGQVGTAVTFLLIGLGIGADTALLLPPKPASSCGKIFAASTKMPKKLLMIGPTSSREAAEDLIERGTEIADEIRERVAPLSKAIRK